MKQLLFAGTLCLAAASASAQLVLGDFEDGTVQGWSGQKDTIVESVAVSTTTAAAGNNSLTGEFDGTLYADQSEGGFQTDLTLTNTDINGYTHAVFSYRVDQDTQTGQGVAVGFNSNVPGGSGGGWTGVTLGGVLEGDGAWHQMVVPVASMNAWSGGWGDLEATGFDWDNPAHEYRFSLNFQGTDEAATGVYYLDDVYLTNEPPEGSVPETTKFAEAPYNETAPGLDGTLDTGEWTGTWYDQWGANHGSADETVAAAPDFAARWTMMHDDNNIYIALEVQDDVRVSGTDAYGGDCVEIYFDAANSNGDGYAGMQARVHYDGTNWVNTSSGATGEFAVNDAAGVWTLEIAFPKNGLDATIISNTIGFDIKVADNDTNENNREINMFWGSEWEAAEHYNNSASWGDVTLIGGPSALKITSNVYPPYIDEGTTVILTAPLGSGYQWFLEGVEISGATNSTLVIDPVAISDEGVYSVDFNDGTSDVSSSFELLVGTEGSVPLAGGFGLAVLLAATGLAGAGMIRKRK